MQQHTLGPWRAHHKTDAHCSNRYMITGISRHDGRIAHVADDVVEHNVPLIVCAPDMLALLRKLYAIEANPAISADIAALLAKAEGIVTTEPTPCAA